MPSGQRVFRRALRAHETGLVAEERGVTELDDLIGLQAMSGPTPRCDTCKEHVCVCPPNKRKPRKRKQK